MPLALAGVFVITCFMFFYSKVSIAQEFLFVPYSLFLPSSLRSLLYKYVFWRQNLYNKITDFFFNLKIINNFFRLYHKALFSFRLYSEYLHTFIEKKYMPMAQLMLAISFICARFHLEEYFIVMATFFFFIEFKTMPMLRYYQKYPLLLDRLYNNQQRYMWSQASRIAQEAASNPQVQAVATAIGGLVVWKVIDVYEIHQEHEHQAANREAENQRADKDREAENQRADKDREAENQRHKDEMAMRQKELDEAYANRMDENRRHDEEMAMRQKELANSQE